MDRNIFPIKTKDGKRYYSITQIPNVPMSNNDIYYKIKPEDRLDILAKKYYDDELLWYIIARSNNVFGIFPDVGQIVRIPSIETISKYRSIIQAQNRE